MKAILHIFLILSIGFNGYSQNLSNKLIGKWQYVGTKPLETIECTDYLIFNTDSTYLILNDCYAYDPYKLIIETGTWQTNKQINIIRLKNRKLDKAYTFQNTKADKLIMHIKTISDTLMEVCFNEQKDCVAECYKKQNTDKEIINVIRNFYKNYITENSKMLVDGKRIDAVKAKYCTTNLLNKIKKEKLDHDVFLNAQDCDANWLKTLSVISESNNSYIASYTDRFSKKKVVINLKVINQNGIYKIDSVW